MGVVEADRFSSKTHYLTSPGSSLISSTRHNFSPCWMAQTHLVMGELPPKCECTYCSIVDILVIVWFIVIGLLIALLFLQLLWFVMIQWKLDQKIWVFSFDPTWTILVPFSMCLQKWGLTFNLWEAPKANIGTLYCFGSQTDTLSNTGTEVSRTWSSGFLVLSLHFVEGIVTYMCLYLSRCKYRNNFDKYKIIIPWNIIK